MIEFKQITRNKLLLVLFSCILTLFLSNRANSQNTTTLAQNFLNINYGGNYYATMLEADRFYKQGDLQKAKQIQKQVKPDFPEPDPVPAAESDLAKLDGTANNIGIQLIKLFKKIQTMMMKLMQEFLSL